MMLYDKCTVLQDITARSTRRYQYKKKEHCTLSFASRITEWIVLVT